MFLGLILWLCCGCATETALSTAKRDIVRNPYSIYVVNHGWHTGLVLPAGVLTETSPWPPGRDASNTRYLEIGWGDEGFYQADEIGPWLAMKAILWPTPSVYHVVALNQPPPQAFPHSESIRLVVERDAVVNLLAYMLQWLQRDEQGKLLYLGKGLYGDSAFFRTSQSYHGLNTCNQFTADALEAAGIDMPDWFSLRAATVMRQLQTYAVEHYQPHEVD